MTHLSESRFAPVFLDEPLDKRLSMTMLRHYNACPRSGLLYEKYKGSNGQTLAMARGTALHVVIQRIVNEMYALEEPNVPEELAKAIVNEVLSEFPVQLEDHDYLREAAYRWASEWTIPPEVNVISCETLFVLELAGWQIRCRVDYATTHDGKVYIADWKSGRGAPAYDAISRKRKDGTMAAKNFQLVLYILAVVFGRPVQVEELAMDTGERVRARSFEEDPEGEWGYDPITHLKRREIQLEPVARGATEAIAEFVYPGIEDKEGHMLRREVSLTRTEMLEYRESLEAILKRVERSEESGDWPAIVSDDACGECPCPLECPIPAELRDYRGTINSHEQAATAAERRYVRRKLDEALGKELKAWSKANDQPIRFGADRILEFGYSEYERVENKDALFAAIANGESGLRSDYVKLVKSTPFAERTLTDDELEGERTDG